LFYTTYDAFGFTEVVFNPVTNGFDAHSALTNTSAYGLELEERPATDGVVGTERDGDAAESALWFVKYISVLDNGGRRLPTISPAIDSLVFRPPASESLSVFATAWFPIATSIFP